MANAHPNDSQIAFWNGKAGEKWTANRVHHDRMIAAPAARAAAAAGFRAGERVIDIGCGCGSSSFEAARAVGPAGRVTGLDISRPMLALARERARSMPELRVEFVEGDASRHPFAEGEADIVVSRFGTMFFADPEEAFANIGRAVRSGGRLAFVCWRRVEENDWIRIPLAAASALADMPQLDAPRRSGPFSLADRAGLIALLEGGGFHDIRVEPFDGPLLLGDTVDAAIRYFSENSPLSVPLSELERGLRQRIREAIAARMSRFLGPNGVEVGGGVWIATARR